MTKRVAAAARGYSVIELMTVLSVTATLAAMAIPTYNGMSKDNRRAAVANELLRTLALARLEAAKRGRTVVACGVVDANGNGQLDEAERACLGRDWTAGWMMGPWTDADADGAVDAGEVEILQVHLNDRRPGVSLRANALAAMPSVAPAGTAVLRPFGKIGSNGTLTLCDTRGPAHARAIVIAPNGRARVSTTKADGSALACP